MKRKKTEKKKHDAAQVYIKIDTNTKIVSMFKTLRLLVIDHIIQNT